MTDIWKKLAQFAFGFPLCIAVGFILLFWLPNRTSGLADKVALWTPLALFGIATFSGKLSIGFLSRKRAVWALLLFFIVVLPVSFVLVTWSQVYFGDKLTNYRSRFLTVADFAGGRDHSLLQGRDLAGFGSGINFKWGAVGKRPPVHCEDSEEFSVVDCAQFELPISGRCFACSFVTPSQDTDYSLVFIQEQRLTEFYSTNHDFHEEHPVRMTKYFEIPSAVLSR